MPFEFTGEAPEFGHDNPSSAMTPRKLGFNFATPATFGSFGSSHSALISIPAGALTSTRASMSTGAGSSFISTSFAARSTLSPLCGPHSPWASFGSSTSLPASSATASFDTPATLASRPSLAPSIATPNSSQNGGADVLSRAFTRAILQKPAFFGRADLGADAVLKGYGEPLVKRGRRVDYEVLQERLGEMKDNQAMDFLRYVFEEAAKAHKIEAPANSRGFTAASDLHHEEDETIRETLVVHIHDALINRKLATNEVNSAGSRISQRSITLAQVALESRSIKQIIEGMEEEEFDRYYDSAYDTKSLHVGFAKWIWKDVCKLRQEYRDKAPWAVSAKKKTVQKKKALAQSTAELEEDSPSDSLSIFRPQSHRASYTSEFKPGQYAPGVFGFKMNTWDENRSCCMKPLISKRKQHSNGTGSSNVPAIPFRLMDLPPELRTLIYRHVIVVGEVRLRSCQHRKPFGVTPGLDLSLLLTSRLVYKEAKYLVFENHFIADAMMVSNPLTNMIPSRLIQLHALPHLTSLTLTMTAIPQPCISSTKPLMAMVRLKSLSIIGIEPTVRSDAKALTTKEVDAMWLETMKLVLQSVPASCKVTIGATSEVERTHQQEFFDELRRGTTNGLLQAYDVLLQDGLDTAAKTVVKGCQSARSGMLPKLGPAALW